MRIIYSSVIMFLVAFLVLFHTIHDYGQTYDEGFYLCTGEVYLKFFRTLNPTEIMNLSVELPNWAATLGAYFANQESILPGSDKTTKFHLAAVVSGAMAVMVLYVFTVNITKNMVIGAFAALALLFYPQFFIHSHFNARDMMLMALYILSVYLMFLYVKKGSWKLLAISALLSGLTMTVKFNAAYLVPIACCCVVLRERNIKKILAGVGVWLMVFSAFTIMFWPYLWFDPPRRIGTIIEFFRHFERGETAYFGTQYFSHQNIPWQYPFVMLGILTPPPLLLLIPFGLFFVWREIRYGRKWEYGVVFLWFFMRLSIFFFPKQSFAFDQIRHFLEVLPVIPLVAALGIYHLYASTNRILLRFAVGAFAVLVIASQMRINILYHPYQTAYFNIFAGNNGYVNQAFDVEYWGHVYKEASRELTGRYPSDSLFYIPSVFGWNLLEANHFPYKLTENMAEDFDYVMVMNRKSLWYKEPYLVQYITNNTPVYTIEREGKVMLYVYKR